MRMPFVDLKGIAARLSALSWLITILTLTAFATAMIPQQKKDLQEALSSKARGISSSLQEAVAGAAISEDYSSVVDQCLQVLAGDEAIAYLAITRSDGFSVVVDKKGWRTQTLDSEWRPEERRPTSFLGYSLLAGRRVFDFGKPFDYSGIRWGWVHIGLSLHAYDESVSRVYWRTGLLAVLCMGLSLVASVWHANRMVRPILSLGATVGRVARGDLSARAEIRSRDELEWLAESFNCMTDSILQRNRVLESIRFAAQEFLTSADWRTAVPAILEKTGFAADISRAFVYRNRRGEDGILRCAGVFEWAAAGARRLDQSQWWEFPWQGGWFEDWAQRLGRGQVVILSSQDLTAAIPVRFDSGVRSRILLPVQVGGLWWGLLGFDDRDREEPWSDAERDTFQAVAGMLGATIARQQAQHDLLKANETLEERVLERTRELQQQVQDKERARADLAAAQQRLMDVSRQAGMAEVAASVLHNVGNVLNSVNTSVGVIASMMRDSRVENIAALVRMIEEHAGHLSEFLAHDVKGRRLLPYLANLSRHFQQERETMLRELALLNDHISHIKSIVATQQRYASVSGLIEEIRAADLVEDAFRIVAAGLGREKIELVRDFESLPPVRVDKHQLLQILLNLLRNAKHAIAEADKPERLIRVRIRRRGEDRFRIEVKDNGVGVAPENLTRIFAHGFTTRRDGHGFGLHSSALAAQRMGGSLGVESEGLGHGATFTVELPLSAKSVSEARS